MAKEDFQKAGLLVAKESLAKVGIDEDLLNRKALEALEAEELISQRHAGFLAPWTKLPQGFRIVKAGEDLSLIVGPRWDIREKARVDLQKRLGLYPAQDINVEHSLSELMAEIIDDVMGNDKGKLPSEEDD